MPDDPRLQAILEELLDSECSPEDACRACPELLPKVRERWQRLRILQTQIGELFPEQGSTDHRVETPRVGSTPELPKIPGYEVQAVLGHGGMGIVYKAWHQRLKRVVALKMLIAGCYAGKQERERFVREAEAVAQLHHANIVQLYDAGDRDNLPYYTMEWVEGGSLARKLAGAPQPPYEAASLVATLAAAIQVAHQHGIVHRDLTPANILLTPDGTPKITDFGLARWLEGGGDLTLSGVPVGTPSYMAPEQARGQRQAIGPATDVYALGAILYEMLTGRPPFREETATGTLHQVLIREPEPPTRIRPGVPRDLQTICLKCLHKEPVHRYPGAAALAEDLQHFLRGEPITARPAGRLERLARWMRRRPALTAAWAASLLLVIVVAGGGGWLIGQRLLIVRAVQAELREAARLQTQSAFPAAGEALERARFRLGVSGPAWLYPVLDEAHRDQQLLLRLEAIRLNRAVYVEGRHNPVAEVRFNNAQAARDYEQAFQERGLFEPTEDPEGVAARLRASPLRTALVAALDDWAVCSSDRARQDWLLRVARLADPDPWRDRVRDPVAWGNTAVLGELARTAPVEQQPITLLLALGERLQIASGDGTELLRRAQQVHPDDFWTTFTLARLIYNAAPQGTGDAAQALPYYQKALALRPGTVAVQNDLGLVLYARYWMDDNPLDWGPGAVTVYRQALLSEPRHAPALNNFGLVMKARGNWDEAALYYQNALQIDPHLAPAHFNLAEVQAGTGHLNEAIDHYRQALQIDPDFAQAHYFLGLALCAKGLLDETNDSYPEGVKALDQMRGQALNEVIARYKQSFLLDPAWVPARNTLRISPADAARLNEAIDHYRQAIRIEPQLAAAHGALGQALLAKRVLGEAEAATRRSLDLLPPSQENLRKNLQCQLERCQHLRALEGVLPALVRGAHKPAPGEHLDLAELCFLRSHYAAAARLYAEALAATPQLGEDLRAGHRFNAARAAALAGSGLGDDRARLGEPERKGLRKQARELLALDLAAWARKLDMGTIADRIEAKKTLSQWRDDPDLAGMREPDALARLSSAEGEQCRALWHELDTLLVRVQASK